MFIIFIFCCHAISGLKRQQKSNPVVRSQPHFVVCMQAVSCVSSRSHK